jgi:hypothetical protein
MRTVWPTVILYNVIYIYNGDVTCSNLCISNDAHTCPRCFYMDIQPMFIQGWTIFRGLCDVPPWRCTMHPSISGPGTNTWPSAWSTSLWREAMLKQVLSRFYAFFPTCQVRVVRFSVSCSARLVLLLLRHLNCKLLIAVVRAGPWTASPGSEWSPPDLNCKLVIAVVPPGPEQQTQDQIRPRLDLNCKR